MKYETKNPCNHELFSALKKNPSIPPQALNSLKKCPLPVRNFEDAFELEGFGEKTAYACQFVLKSLGLFQTPSYDRLSVSLPKLNNFSLVFPYIPKKNSAPFAILMALGDLASQSPVTKSAIIDQGARYTSVSFHPEGLTSPHRRDRRQPANFYSGWSSCKNLIERGLVEKPTTKSFQLTDSGRALYKHLKDSLVATSLTIPVSVSSTSGSSSPKVQLLYDYREFRKDSDEVFLRSRLQERGALARREPLVVGDYFYLLSDKGGCSSDVLEWGVPGVVVERKRCDDLASSIKDGRYRLQKSNMKRVGSLGLTMRVLLVEGSLENEAFALPVASLRQAMVSSELAEGFLVIQSKNREETTRALGWLALSLLKVGKSLTTYREFARNCKETVALDKEVNMARKLCAIEGVSPENALSLSRRYRGFLALRQSFPGVGKPGQEKYALSEFEDCFTGKKLGKVTSSRIYGFLFYQ